MGKIKIGVFGAGRGKTMIREMMNNPEAEVVAICDKYQPLLDECQKYGIRVIVCDHRARWGGASKDPAAYEAQFRAAYEDFGHHPAV